MGAGFFAAGLPVSLARWKVVGAGVEVAAVKLQMLLFLVCSSKRRANSSARSEGVKNSAASPLP
jgi:hypothetical protein